MNPTRFALTVLSLVTCSLFVRVRLYSDDVTLRWNGNTESDLAGYRLYYGTRSRDYDEVVDTGDVRKFTIAGLEGGSTYYFALTAYDKSGAESDWSGEVTHRIEETNEQSGSLNPALSGVEAALPKRLALYQNYPNPFNPVTTIAFDIPAGADPKERVGLTVYDLRGRHIRSLIDRDLAPGTYRIVWDGRTETGERIPSGIFLCRLDFRGRSLTRKITAVE